MWTLLPLNRAIFSKITIAFFARPLLSNHLGDSDIKLEKKICLQSVNCIKICSFFRLKTSTTTNRIDGVMVTMLASSAVDRGLEVMSGQTKDY